MLRCLLLGESAKRLRYIGHGAYKRPEGRGRYGERYERKNCRGNRGYEMMLVKRVYRDYGEHRCRKYERHVMHAGYDLHRMLRI